jgi:DNA uptake protein ComE-like DNA-binding protein
MARGHWLDPLARKVLQALGDLPVDTSAPTTLSASSSSQIQETDWFLDVNRATAEQWQRLPGCTAAMVDLLIRLQQGGVQFSQAEDLFQLL